MRRQEAAARAAARRKRSDAELAAFERQQVPAEGLFSTPGRAMKLQQAWRMAAVSSAVHASLLCDCMMAGACMPAA
jgi:hypothetical protein